MGEDRVLDLLEAADWNDITIQLTYYAVGRARLYSWKSGNPNQLPGGKTPEDIVCEAIEKVWNGTRKWDPDKYPDLLNHLQWIVKSDIGHLFSSAEHRKTGRMPAPKNNEESESSRSELIYSSTLPIYEPFPSPEEEIIAREDRDLEEKLKDELYAAVEGDEDLELLLLCIEDGIDKPKAIADQTGWEISKTYNLKRKLLRTVAKLAKTPDGSNSEKGRAA